jgi:hypothetical protein
MTNLHQETVELSKRLTCKHCDEAFEYNDQVGREQAWHCAGQHLILFHYGIYQIQTNLDLERLATLVDPREEVAR